MTTDRLGAAPGKAQPLSALFHVNLFGPALAALEQNGGSGYFSAIAPTERAPSGANAVHPLPNISEFLQGTSTVWKI